MASRVRAVVAVALSGAVSATSPVALAGASYSTNFSSAEGYAIGPIGGQVGWQSSLVGNQQIVAGGVGGSNQSLRLSQGSTADPRPLGLALSPIFSAALTSMSIQSRVDDNGGATYFVGGQSLSANTQVFRIEFDFEGKIWVLDPSAPGAINGLINTGVSWRQNLWTELSVAMLGSSIQYTYNGTAIYTGQRFGGIATIEQVVLGHDNFQDIGAGPFSGASQPAAAYFGSVAVVPAPGALGILGLGLVACRRRR